MSVAPTGVSQLETREEEVALTLMYELAAVHRVIPEYDLGGADCPRCKRMHHFTINEDCRFIWCLKCEAYFVRNLNVDEDA